MKYSSKNRFHDGGFNFDDIKAYFSPEKIASIKNTAKAGLSSAASRASSGLSSAASGLSSGLSSVKDAYKSSNSMDGHKNSKEFKVRIGSYTQVWNGTALRSPGGLHKEDLMRNKRNKIVSKAKHRSGKIIYEKYLKPLGYVAKKGVDVKETAKRFKKMKLKRSGKKSKKSKKRSSRSKK